MFRLYICLLLAGSVSASSLPSIAEKKTIPKPSPHDTYIMGSCSPRYPSDLPKYDYMVCLI